MLDAPLRREVHRTRFASSQAVLPDLGSRRPKAHGNRVGRDSDWRKPCPWSAKRRADESSGSASPFGRYRLLPEGRRRFQLQRWADPGVDISVPVSGESGPEKIDAPANPSWLPYPKSAARTWMVGNRSPTEADDRKLSFRVLMMHSDRPSLTDRSRTCSFPLDLLRRDDPVSGIRVAPSGSLRDSAAARSWTSPFWFSFQRPSRGRTGEWSTGAGHPTAQADHSNPEKARRFVGPEK